MLRRAPVEALASGRLSPVPGEVGGAQSIGRALQVLKFVASQPGGTRLRDVVAACELNKATAHRILAALVADGFVHVPDGGNRYELGREALIIGWAARARQDLRELAHRSMARICQATGDTVFLSVRSGSEAVCIERHVGDFPIKTLTLDVGSRRPLGVGSGSLAILAFLPDDEIDDVLDGIAPRLGPYPLMSPSSLRELARQTRRQGYAFNDQRVIEGMSALGAPIIGSTGRPVGALSVAAITSRMREDRRPEIIDALRQEADRLGELLKAGARAVSGSG